MNQFAEKAAKHFGITNNPLHLFYILPDGSWLDGSGAYWFDTLDSRLKYLRTTKYRILDHIDVGELNFISSSGFDATLDFMHMADAARADTIAGYLAIMQGNKHFKTIAQSFAKANLGKYAAIAIYSYDGYIVAETEFNNTQPRKLVAWFEEHMHDKPTKVKANTMKKIIAEIEALDTIVMDLPLTMRLFELCRESIKDDIHLHTLTSALLDLRTQKECLTMDDYPAILKMADINPEEPETQEALEDISEDY